MRKYSFIIIILATAVFASTIASYAETIKVITLKDGSILKGNVIELTDSIYTLETSNLGRINIPESDILSITAAQTENETTEKTQLKTQVQQLQGNILTDPGLMTEIQDIANDEDVKAMLSDPKLLEDILSYDQEKIQKNDHVHSLMQNPKIQNLINKIQQKIPSQ